MANKGLLARKGREGCVPAYVWNTALLRKARLVIKRRYER